MIDRIQPPNLEQITHKLPHRLYANNSGCHLEIQTHLIQNVMGQVRSLHGIILGMTHSGNGGTTTETFFISEQGNISRIALYRCSPAYINITLLYMLLNPIPEIDGWHLRDLRSIAQEEGPPIHEMIGMDVPTLTRKTYHRELEVAIMFAVSLIGQLSVDRTSDSL